MHSLKDEKMFFPLIWVEEGGDLDDKNNDLIYGMVVL